MDKDKEWLDKTEKRESKKSSGFSLGAMLGEKLELAKPQQEKPKKHNRHGQGFIRYKNGKKVVEEKRKN